MMKKKTIIPIALLTMFVGVSHVDAYRFSVGYADTGEHVESQPREDIKYEWEADISGNYKTAYTCSYNYTVSVSKNITINGYDMENNEIMRHSLKISDANRILAGTSIGLNIYETKSVTWKVTKAEVTYDRKRRYARYKCTYKNAAPAQDVVQPAAVAASINTLSKAIMIANNTCSNKTKYIYSWESCPAASSGCEFVSGPTFSHYTDYDHYTSTTPPADALAEKQKQCTEMATKAAINSANGYFYPSYQIKLSDSNEIGGDNMEVIESNSSEYSKNGVVMTGCSGSSCKFQYDANLATQPSSETIVVKYYYNPKKVCIDVKTADVRYTNDACNATERQVEHDVVNNLEHWHYFVPLNAKSTDEIELNLLPTGSGSNLRKEECNYVMKNNPVYYDINGKLVKNKTTYLDLIMPKTDGAQFEGNYCYNLNGTERCNENSSDYREILNNGCSLTSKIKIPIEQKFYNEVGVANDEVKFNGFNFYYKPIGIDNPFPNGITEPSLWKEWDESLDKTPDISTSYSTMTYIAQNINATKVRNYKKSGNCGENELCLYTNWLNMNIDGTSGFIDTEGIVTRGQSLTHYKLGCGPLNVNEKLEDGTDNHLYIEGCGS